LLNVAFMWATALTTFLLIFRLVPFAIIHLAISIA
jgi:hypothetical protein